MPIGIECPHCGGRQLLQITPSEFECVTPHPDRLAPGPGGFMPMRPCTHRFQVATGTQTPLCFCGRESIGTCQGCEQRLCGLHGSGDSAFLCAECTRQREAERFTREAAEERDRQAGLIPFRKLLTAAAGDHNAASEAGTDKVHFDRIWEQVAQAILSGGCPPDLMMVDDRRSDQLPERWPKRGGERKKQRYEARWNEAADALAIPAWDMEATFSSGSGIADTYSRLETPMYFGSNGLLYVGRGSQTPAGTHSGGRTYPTPSSIPEIWEEKWGAWGTIDNRREVAVGFANLVVKHGLEIGI